MAAWLESLVADAHTALLTEGEVATRYLASRGVTPEDVERFRLGFVPARYRVQECSEDFARWYPHFLLGRLIFPLTSTLGTVIGLQARSLTAKDYRQFFAYPSETHPYMFGVGQAMAAIWETRTIVLTEGAFDCLAASKVAPNTVAMLTASVSQPCRKFLDRFVRHVVVLFDMDKPGRDGARRVVMDYTERPFTVSVPTYRQHDPADLFMVDGMPGLTRVLRGVGPRVLESPTEGRV